MKKIIICLLVLNMCVLNVNNIKANTYDVYEYYYNNYSTKINQIYMESGFVCQDITENDINFVVKFSPNLDYVIVDGQYYSMDTYNEAASIQAETLYLDNVSLTFIDVLKEFDPISNLNELIRTNELIDASYLEFVNTMVSPMASYGTFYKVAEVNKKDMYVALTSAAIGVIVTFFTSGAMSGVTFTLSQQIAISFVTSILGGVAADFIYADMWYAKWQAIISYGVAQERRQLGCRTSETAAVIWDVDENGDPIYCYSTTFQTVRPGY